jgi:2-(1,2-epoxy-1,2-dihydrophenyl)acetyl-CoA isomerase
VAGAGLGIMLAGDLVIAAEGTKFVFGYPEIGVTPDCGVSQSLPRAMGQQRALAFALSGKALSAESALAQGLITEISPEPLARAREAAAAWVAGASGAYGASRRLLRQSPTLPRDVAGRNESVSIGERVASPESQALIGRFLRR